MDEETKRFRMRLTMENDLVVEDGFLIKPIIIEPQEGDMLHGTALIICPMASHMCLCGREGCKGAGIPDAIHTMVMQ